MHLSITHQFGMAQRFIHIVHNSNELWIKKRNTCFPQDVSVTTH